MHILPAGLWSVIAPLQLSPTFRARHHTAHRRLGRLFIFMSASIAIGVVPLIVSGASLFRRSVRPSLRGWGFVFLRFEFCCVNDRIAQGPVEKYEASLPFASERCVAGCGALTTAGRCRMGESGLGAKLRRGSHPPVVLFWGSWCWSFGFTPYFHPTQSDIERRDVDP